MNAKHLNKIRAYFQKCLLYCIHIKLADSNQNLNQAVFNKIKYFLDNNSDTSEFINEFCKQIQDISEKSKWSARQKNHLIADISKIDLIECTMQFVAEKLLADNTEWITDPSAHIPNIGLTISIDEIQKAIEGFKREQLIAQDKREQVDERPIRRMDSLARILSFKARLSPCTSVAIVNNTLYVSANVSVDGTQDEMAKYIYSRAGKLQALILKIQREQDLNKSSDFEAILENHSQALALEMVTESSLSVSTSRLASDISKFVHSIVLDNETFGDRTKRLWLTQPLKISTLLPHQGDKEIVSLAVYQNASESSINFALPNARHIPKVSNYHAEQMLVHFLQSNFIFQATMENPMLLGISKLCCKTCYDNLNGQGVKVRGTHNQAYENIEPLINPHYVLPCTPKGNLQKGDCGALRSVEKSHYKKEKQSVYLKSQYPSARRKLDFSGLSQTVPINNEVESISHGTSPHPEITVETLSNDGENAVTKVSVDLQQPDIPAANSVLESKKVIKKSSRTVKQSDLTAENSVIRDEKLATINSDATTTASAFSLLNFLKSIFEWLIHKIVGLCGIQKNSTSEQSVSINGMFSGSSYHTVNLATDVNYGLES